MNYSIPFESHLDTLYTKIEVIVVLLVVVVVTNATGGGVTFGTFFFLWLGATLAGNSLVSLQSSGT